MNKDSIEHVLAAKTGAWVAFDGYFGEALTTVPVCAFRHHMKNNQCLHRLLLSQDAGWYDPDKPDGSIITPIHLILNN